MSDFLDDLTNSRQDPRDRQDPRVRVDLREIAEHERIPMQDGELKLALPAREGYHRHWVNDKGNRIARARDAGYVHILRAGVHVGTGIESNSTNLGDVISYEVGTKSDGSPQLAFAMEIRQEWYDRDQAKVRAPNRQTQSEIANGGLPTTEGGDSTHRYVPDEGIQIG